MKTSSFNSLKFVKTTTNFLSLFIIFGFISISIQAQTQPAQDHSAETEKQNLNLKFSKRPSLLQSLNLTVDQTQQIRSINMETHEAARQAYQRLRTARRALDAAIYADSVDQALIDERLRELNTAQTEASKLKVTIELRIRQVLTPEQLVRFRELRQNAEQKFRERRESMPASRKTTKF